MIRKADLRQPFLFIALCSLAALYLQLSAQFIAVMQVLVYAGAIFVIFVFVIVLFQDAHDRLHSLKLTANRFFFILPEALFSVTLLFFGKRIDGFYTANEELPAGLWNCQSHWGSALSRFLFPF